VGKARSIGIGVGASVGGLIAFLVVYALVFSTIQGDDARLAELRVSYYKDTDRLSVALILHNADGEFTKANGHMELFIKKNNILVYTANYDFVKDDFLTWDTIGAGKVKGVLFDIREMFPGGSYDVYANLETKSGSYWKDLHDSFYSLE